MQELEALAEKVEPRVVAWRRDFHRNPELGNREFRTAGIVAAHLKFLGFDEVREKVAHTGVVGILRGGKPAELAVVVGTRPGKPR
jgi:amidohydrolase